MKQRKSKKLSINTAIDRYVNYFGKVLEENGRIQKANIQFKIAQEVIDVMEQDFQCSQISN